MVFRCFTWNKTMNIKSTTFRYKKIIKIVEIQKTLKGTLLKFFFNSESINPPQILNSSDYIYYYDYMGNPREGLVSKIKVGDYLIEYIEGDNV